MKGENEDTRNQQTLESDIKEHFSRRPEMKERAKKEPVHLKRDWTCVSTSKGHLGVYPPKANTPGGKHWKGTEVEVRAIGVGVDGEATRAVCRQVD